MFEKIISFIKNKKKIIENFSYLGFLQIFQLLIPLLIYPYLIRVVGSELYGKVIYAQVFVSYFLVFIKFGFDMYGTNQIAVHSSDKKKMSDIVSVIYSIRFFFLILAMLVLFGAIYFNEHLKTIKVLLWYCFLLNIGEFLYPIWFFLGIEKMKYIAIINITSKVFYLGLVFFFIKTKNDYLLIPLLLSISSIIGGIMSLYLLIFKLRIIFKKPKVAEMVLYVNKSVTYFINSLSIILVEKTNVILLGSFIGMKEVAYYDLASKIIQLAKTPFSILSSVLFPNFSKNLTPLKIKKALFTLGVISLFVLFLVNFLGENIIEILGGVEMHATKKILFVLSLVLPFVAISIVLGISLAAKGYSKEFMIADLIYLLVYLVLVYMFYLTKSFNIYTISYSILIGVISNTIYKFIKIKKHKLL